MDSLQSHRHFQRAGEQVPEPQSFVAHQARMRLYDHMPGKFDSTRNGRVVRDGNRGRVKEASAIVKFQLFGTALQLCQGKIDLFWNDPRGN